MKASRIVGLGLLLVMVGSGCRSLPKPFQASREVLPKPALGAVAQPTQSGADSKAPVGQDSAPDHRDVVTETKAVDHTEPEVVDESSKMVISPPTDPFDPKDLSPLSPAAMIAPGPMPKGHEERLKEFDRIGKALADASDADIPFRFETMYNPRRASTCHTDAGHVLMTSSMLEKIRTRHQLAAALALEMAECIEEAAVARDVALSGVPTGNTTKVAPRAEKVESTASNLLAEAGFERIDLAAVKEDLAGVVAGGDTHRSAKTSGGEVPWNGPTPAAAN